MLFPSVFQSFIPKTAISFFLIFLILLPGICISQKIPFVFRMQENKAKRRIHRYVDHDTIIKTSAASIHLHYSNANNKPYLLLLHGMGIDAKSNWYRQIKPLSKHFNLLMPDLIYFGRSTSDSINYSVEFQATQINEVLGKLRIGGQLNVMGFSYGGLVAAMYNQLFSSQINKLIIIDGPVKYYSSHMADSLALLFGVKGIKNIIAPQNPAEFSAMQKAVLSRKIPVTRRFKRKFINHYFTPGVLVRQAQIEYLVQQQLIYQSFNYNLDNTETLFIWGRNDGVVPLSVGQQLHQRFRRSKLIVLKKARHDGHFRYYRTINHEVIRFLKH